MKTPRAYLENVLDAIAAIEEYQPASEAALEQMPMARDAIFMRLQDIGENLVHVRDNFPDFWEQHATNIWFKAVGLRHAISHEYGAIRLSTIWEVIASDLRDLKSEIARAADGSPR